MRARLRGMTLVLVAVVSALSCAAGHASVGAEGKVSGARCQPKQTVRVNGLDLEYDTFGSRSDPPMVLIMGLATQMTAWSEDFCRALAAKGYWVIRFDNRDVGLSTKLEGASEPSVLRALINWKLGYPVRAPYSLAHMAADAVGIMSALGIERAHVVGASMGGMIAQHVAAYYPHKVLSLTSIMSTTGNRRLPGAQKRALEVLMARAPDERAAQVERTMRVFEVIGSPGYPSDPTTRRAYAEAAYDRCHYPAGARRQLLAILAAPDRTEKLKSLRVPTLVIHGKADPLIPYAAGVATAEAVPGAKLLLIDGMGHDLPRAVWPQILDALDANARAGGRAEDS